MSWKTLLVYSTGTVDQELLLRNEYLVIENCILRNQMKGRLRLSDGERTTLAKIGHKLGNQALKEVAKIVNPDTILAWHRKRIAQKFDGSTQRKAPGRPTIDGFPIAMAKFCTLSAAPLRAGALTILLPGRPKAQ